MRTPEPLVARELFGGAMAISLPARFRDMSEVIAVPDHQEVFAAGAEDQSLVVEINESCAVGDADVGQHYFNDLAALSEATSCTIDGTQPLGPADVPSISNWSYGCICRGSQLVVRGNSHVPVDTCCLAAVLRQPHVQSDIVIVLTTPAVAPVGSGGNGAPNAAAQRDEALLLLKDVLLTLQIKDYSLFGSA